MISIYVTFIIAYLTLYFFGYPLKVLLLNDDLKKFDLYITPWLGIGVIICALFPLSWLGYSVESAAGYFAFAILAANAAIFLKYRELPRFEAREAILIIITGVITGTVYGGILALRGPGYFAATMGADFGVYLNVAKAALVSSAREMSALPDGIPLIRPVSDILNIQLRGAVYVHAFFAALYKVELVHILYALLSFVMFLNAVTFRLFLGKTRNLWILIPLIAIFSINTFYQKMVFMSFMGQIFSLGLVTLAFYLEYYLSERKRFDPKTCAALVFIISVNTLCWLEGMVFPLLPAIALAVAVTLNKRYDKKSCAANTAFTAGLWALCNFKLIILFVNLFFILDNTPQGWPMPMTTFMDLSGLRGVASSPELASALLILSNAILIPVLFYQLIKEKLSSFLSVSFLAFMLLHLFFCVRYFEPGERASYNIFKSALSLSFIVIIFILRFIEEKSFRLPAAKGGIAVVAVFTVFFVLNLASCQRNMREIAAIDGAMLSARHDALGMFAENPVYRESSFIVNIGIPLTQYIAEYYAPTGHTYATNMRHEPDFRGRFENLFKPGDMYVADPTFEEMMRTTDAEAIFENDIYKIYRLATESILLYEYTGMSDKIDVLFLDGEYMALRRLTASKAGLMFACLENRAANLEFSFYDRNKSDSLGGKLFVNGEFLEEVYSNDGFIDVKLNGVQMKQGMNDIMLEFGGDVSNVSLAGMKIF